MYIISDNKLIPEGYRRMTEEEIAEDFLKIDNDKNYFVTKNEWMIFFIKKLGEDMAALDAEGPNSIMNKIDAISDEFDKIDNDRSGEIDFLEYKEFVENNVFVSI